MTPPNNGASTPHGVAIEDVPVDAFWPIAVYGADRLIPEKDLGNDPFNDKTAKANEHGSMPVDFGACGDGRVNCIPIGDGRNDIVRQYEPRQEPIDGKWKLPAPTPVD